MSKNIFIILFILFLFPFFGESQDTISVTDFGAKPNSFLDATQAVQKAIEACKTKPNSVLFFPTGRYDFYAENAIKKEYYISNTSSETEASDKTKTIGLYFQNCKNLILEGSGSLFIFHEKMTTWVLDACENVKIQNVSMDFEHPTMIEMTILEKSDSMVVVDVNQDSQFEVVGGKINFFGEGWRMEKNYFTVISNPETGVYRYSNFKNFRNAKAESFEKNKVRFFGDFSKFKGKPSEVLSIRDCIRDQVGALILHSKNISLENVNMHYMHGLGIIAMFSENLHYNQVNVVPRKETKRTISSFADGFHFSGCKGDIVIENAHCSGMHDDFINVHGTHLMVSEIVSPTKLKVEFKHHQTYGFEAFFAGDSIAFVHSTSLQIFGNAVVKTAKLISKTEMLVELNTNIPADLKVGDCLENSTWTPSVTIKNSRFEGCITRGILITTNRKVVIENNHFYRVGMPAILIADDASSWFESGQVADVSIRNNVFEECSYNSAPGNYIIAIVPENHKLIANYWVHRNIFIENNIFKIYDYPILTARSTQNLVYKNNVIQWTNFMEKGEKRAAFHFTACSKVVVEHNLFPKEVPIFTLENMLTNELTTDVKTDLKPVILKSQIR